MKTIHGQLILLAITLFLICNPVSWAGAEEMPVSLPELASGETVSKADETGRYIIKFEDPPLALYPPGTFSGEIVICDRGEIARMDKGENVLQGGAGGYVLANDAANDRSLNADAHFLPAVHISYADGVALKNWLASGSNHSAIIIGTAFDIDASHGDVMAAFSSRGENGPLPSIIKPDVTAPGVNILAAGGTFGDVAWEVQGGTSMASPHASGASALLMARHPFWTPAEVQSALMSTSATALLKENVVSPAGRLPGHHLIGTAPSNWARIPVTPAILAASM